MSKWCRNTQQSMQKLWDHNQGGRGGGGIGGCQLNWKFMRVWQRQYGGHGLEKTMSDNDEMGPKLISKAIKEKTTKLYS